MYAEEFITMTWGKRSADLPADQIESLPKIKRERGEFVSPRYTPVSRLSDGFAVIQLKMVVPVTLIRRTEPCGPWHDDEPEPCGRLR